VALDVRDPQPVRCGRREPPLHQIRRPRPGRVRDRGPLDPPPRRLPVRRCRAPAADTPWRPCADSYASRSGDRTRTAPGRTCACLC
jgi:hypothetical protein